MKRFGWIDFSKGIAIIAVILDHAFLIFPVFYRQIIWQHMMFAVLWFVVLSGFTNSLSAQKGRSLDSLKKIIRFWVKRSAAIYIPYLIASLFYYIALYHRTHTISEFLFLVVNFRVMPLFYFVHLILQLYLLFPFLFWFAKTFNKPWVHGIMLLALTLITVVYFPVKVPPWTILLGQDFFARSYIVLFYMGIIWALNPGRENRLMAVGSIILFIGMEKINISTYFRMIGGIPTLPWILWVVSGLGVAKIIHQIIPNNPVFQAIRFLGKESMFIYLFHYAILTLISEKIIRPLTLAGFIFIIGFSIGFSLFARYTYILIPKILISCRNAYTQFKR